MTALEILTLAHNSELALLKAARERIEAKRVAKRLERANNCDVPRFWFALQNQPSGRTWL